MSYLSLLLASVTQNLSIAVTAGPEDQAEGYCFPDTAECAWSFHPGASDDYVLPSGIESLDHWLDLNA